MQTKLIIALVVLVFLGVYGGAIGWKAYTLGQENIQVKWDKAITIRTDQKLNIKEKQDEVQNAPIDDTVTVRRLRNGSF